MYENRKWIIFSMLLILVTGLLGGTLLGIFIERRHNRIVPHGDMEVLREYFVGKLRKELSLTPPQVNELRRIMKENDDEFMAFRKKMRGELLGLHHKFSSRMEAILDEEQKKKFEKSNRVKEEQIKRDFKFQE